MDKDTKQDIIWLIEEIISDEALANTKYQDDVRDRLEANKDKLDDFRDAYGDEVIDQIRYSVESGEEVE